MKRQHYTFGDTELAAERLATLARVFEPSSARLLERLARPAGALALDLGCGPGYTTRLLAEHVGCTRVIGLEQSPRLLEHATRQGSDRVSFAQCDVSKVPFPVPPAQVSYSRFLLTHLANPGEVLRAWATITPSDARLVLEETAFMTGQHPAFARYYGLVERMQAHYAQRMYIGRELEALPAAADWIVESAEIAVSDLAAEDMARLHFLNLQTWSSDAFARAHYSPSELSELGAELERIASGEISAPPVACGLGQVILRRRA